MRAFQCDLCNKFKNGIATQYDYASFRLPAEVVEGRSYHTLRVTFRIEPIVSGEPEKLDLCDPCLISCIDQAITILKQKHKEIAERVK